MNRTLDTALAKPEAGVTPPTRKRQSSLTAQVRDLGIGDSCAKVSQIHPDARLGDIQLSMSDWRAKLRDNVEPSVAPVRRETGAKFTIEVSDFRTASQSWFLVAVITRVE